MDSREAFVDRFRAYWHSPTPEGLSDVLHDDVVLTQPLARRMRGLAAAQAEFGRIFAWLPDLHATVDRWGGNEDTVFIEFRLQASLAGRPLEWPVVDRFTLRGDKASERATYFDGLPLVLRLVRTPAAWMGWWRSGAGRFW